MSAARTGLPNNRGLSLQEQAAFAVPRGLLLVHLQQSRAGGGLKDLANTLVGAGRALEVLVGTDLLANFLTLHGQLARPLSTIKKDAYLLRADGLLGGLVQLLNGLGVVAQILLAANKDDWEALAEVKDLGDPLETSQHPV